MAFRRYICLVLFLNGALANDLLFSKFHQHAYKIKDFRGELDGYDKKVFNRLHMVTYKYNRSTPLLNLTFNTKIQVDMDLVDILFQAYKFASNEYREFPIRFQVNFKMAIIANIAGFFSITECGNITDLDFKKDVTYHVCNFSPDETMLPPLIPTGRYRLVSQWIYLDNIAASTSDYFEIYVPIKIPPK